MQVTKQKTLARAIGLWMSVLLLGLQLFGQVAHTRWHEQHSCVAPEGTQQIAAIGPDCEFCSVFAQPATVVHTPPVLLSLTGLNLPLMQPTLREYRPSSAIRLRGPPRAPPFLA